MKHPHQSDYDVLQYVLPLKSAEAYAADAIAVLQQFDIQYLPYFLRSDVVLTLSGVRAFDTYIGFEKLSPEVVFQFQQLLSSRGFTLESENSEYEEPIDFYSLINHAALQVIPSQYTFDGWFNPHPPYTTERMHLWTYHIERTLVNLMAAGKLPKEWLVHPISAHNIRFGILLGYPGEAIASDCWMKVLQTESEPNAASSVIAYRDAYDAAWPIYSYSKDLQDNPDIKAHQQLWSDVLTGIYESDWHRGLLANKDFQSAAARIHKLKEPYDAADE